MQGIKRAIVSCFDKRGIVELCRVLREFDVEIVSTAGTLEVLASEGIEAQSISEYTGVREMMDGRVKSIHPKVHAGLLGIRGNRVHEEEMEGLNYGWIDLVVVNLQPIEAVLGRSGVTFEEVMLHVDIGGLAMIRSGAKNFRYVSVAVNPERYSTIIHEMRAGNGAVPFSTRYRLAQEAFECASVYDGQLAEYLRTTEPPEE